MWEGLARGFEEETGANVNIQYTSSGASVQQDILRMQQAGDPPELSMIGIPRGTSLANAGALAPMDEVIDVFEEQWGEIPQDAKVQFDGNNYYLGYFMNVVTNWYRSDVFSEAPNTWEKMIRMARENDSSDGVRGAMVMPNQNWVAQLAAFSAAFGADANLMARQDGEIRIVADSDEHMDGWVNVLNFFNDLYQYSDPHLDTDPATWVNLTNSGDAHQTYITGSRPVLGGGPEEVMRNLEPVPFPAPEEDQADPWGNIGGWIALDGAENTDVGIEFLKWYSRPENIMDALIETDFVHVAPIVDGIAEHERYQTALDEQLPEWTDKETALAYLESTNTATSLIHETDPPNPYAGNVHSSYDVALMVRNVLVNDKDPQQAVADGADRMREVLSDAKN
jgi:ABC-type glycerol-3-phosphate transport system substrate-binding protein